MDDLIDLDHRTIDDLKDLIRINIDSSNGFSEAADHVDDDSLASMFRKLSTQRRSFADELRQFIAINDEEASDTGSIQGAVHRWWMIIRDAVSGDDDYSVLAEAERGEDAIKDLYEDVLLKTLGSPVHQTLQQQYSQVQESHDTIRKVRDAAKNLH